MKEGVNGQAKSRLMAQDMWKDRSLRNRVFIHENCHSLFLHITNVRDQMSPNLQDLRHFIIIHHSINNNNSFPLHSFINY